MGGTELEVEASQHQLHLSIIVPFHNSAHKSSRLLNTLAGLNDSSIEVICVDDGSVDNTVAVLHQFAQDARVSVTVIVHDNKGPGGARNSALQRARGEYVWFVDSDDDIRLQAIEHFATVRTEGYDFIDYDIELVEARNSMGLDEGAYTNSAELRSYLVAGNYGGLCMKIIRREFLIKNQIWYPEYCFYEDNFLTFVLPLLTEKFYKSALVGYKQFVDFASVTRNKVTPRFYDRLHTAEWGLASGRLLARSQAELTALEERFVDLFLIKSPRQILRRSHSKIGLMSSLRARKYGEFTRKVWAHLSFKPLTRGYLESARVMRYYRQVARSLGVSVDPLALLEQHDKRYQSQFHLLWKASHLLGSQHRYFGRLRRRAWGKQTAAFEPAPPQSFNSAG